MKKIISGFVKGIESEGQNLKFIQLTSIGEKVTEVEIPFFGDIGEEYLGRMVTITSERKGSSEEIFEQEIETADNKINISLPYSEIESINGSYQHSEVGMLESFVGAMTGEKKSSRLESGLESIGMITPVEKYPQRIKLEEKGYEVIVKVYGYFEHFWFGIAQQGDLKGSVKIKGNGATVRYGNRFFIANLDGCGDYRSFENFAYQKRLVNKSHKEQDSQLIEKLVRRGLSLMRKGWR